MGFLLILVALFAGLSLLPDSQRDKYGINVPGLRLKKRTAQGVLFGALVLALIAMRLFPFALLAALVGASVMGMSWWRERALDETIQEHKPRPGPSGGRKAAGGVNSKMSVDEAMDVLGLDHSAGMDDVDSAYRKLMAQIHPDKGGTDYLAAKINEARDVLKKTLG